MAINVNSPYSGRTVKVRDQDAGRAVKDEEGRLFYVLPRSEGGGYYGSMTRAPNTKDEARAREMDGKLAVQRGAIHEQAEAVRSPRGGWKGKLVILILLLLVLVGAWLLYRALKSRPPGTEVVPSNPIPVGSAGEAARTLPAHALRTQGETYLLHCQGTIYVMASDPVGGALLRAA